MKSTRSLSLALLCAFIATVAMIQVAPSSAVQGQQPTSTFVYPTFATDPYYPTDRPLPTVTPGPTITPSGPLIQAASTQIAPDGALTIIPLLDDTLTELGGFSLANRYMVYQDWGSMRLKVPNRDDLVLDLYISFSPTEQIAYDSFNRDVIYSAPFLNDIEIIDGEMYVAHISRRPNGELEGGRLAVARFRNVSMDLIPHSLRIGQEGKFNITRAEVSSIFSDVKTWLAKER